MPSRCRPTRCPSRLGLRPLKAWRYIGVFGPEFMICVAAVRIGRARQSFWAVWDRGAQRLHETTWLSAGGVRLAPGSARVVDGPASLQLTFAEGDGVETVCRSGDGYGWTRKQGGIAVSGTVQLAGGGPRAVDARAVIDDTSAYYERHTAWRWCAGVGADADGPRPGLEPRRGRERSRPAAASGPCGSTASRARPGRWRSPQPRCRRRPALPCRGRPRAPPEPGRGAKPLSPAVRDLLGRAARRLAPERGLRGHGGPRRVVVRRGVAVSAISPGCGRARDAARPAASWSASRRSARAAAGPRRR